MGRPKKSIERHLDPAALDAAIDAAQRRGEARLVRRLCLVKDLYAGDAVTEAAERVGVSQPTASRWAEDWNERGVEGLRPDFGGGRPSRLDEADLDRLADLLERYGPFTTGQTRRLLADGFGASYSRRHVRRILDRLGVDAAPSPTTSAEDDASGRLDAALEALDGGHGDDAPGGCD